MVITESALLIRMLLAHFAADFMLQSKSMVDKKGRGAWKSGWLHVHAAVYTVLVFLMVAKWTTWYWLVPGLYLSHVLIDGWKARRGNRTWTFVGDQLAHLAALASCSVSWGVRGPRPRTIPYCGSGIRRIRSSSSSSTFSFSGLPGG